ncbi:hypothetical protein PoB_004094000 [Plakobranchus ocellatus]|uniref:Uncharacterized protein n=1 Tax=Plakobranchus ocellatus TaxID=259542 RepID=A0AAV4B4A7_9GAST|nr:hypothetical protein PoB_004094000 [Plakobranchus ocellatus]
MDIAQQCSEKAEDDVPKINRPISTPDIELEKNHAPFHTIRMTWCYISSRSDHKTTGIMLQQTTREEEVMVKDAFGKLKQQQMKTACKCRESGTQEGK